MGTSFIYLMIGTVFLITSAAAYVIELRVKRHTDPAPVMPAEVPEGLLPPWLEQDLYEAARKVGSKPVKLLQLAVALQLRQAREQGEPTSGVLSGIKIPDDVVDDTATMFAEDYAEQISEEPAEMADEDIATREDRDGEEDGRVTPTLISEKPPKKPKPFS
jgi:hypothetical protein